MNGTLLLTGANGRTGRAVLSSLVHAKIPVRVLVRDAAQAPNLLRLGAKEHVVGDLEDHAGLSEAMAGTSKVLHIGPPMHPGEFDTTKALVDHSKKLGVEQFIYYSVMHPLARAIRHHSLKLDAEEYLIDSGVPYVILQPSRYMQHLEAIWAKVQETGVHAMPFSTEQAFSVVDLVDLADACAVTAGTDRFMYGTYELAGPEALSQNEMAAIISKTLNRPVKAEAVGIEQMRERALSAGASEDRVQQMAIMNTHYDAHGFRSNAEVLQLILGRPATTFSAYVERLAHKI